MTHEDLVKRAERWLRNTIGCGVVLTEAASGSETPDAIGWKGGYSHLVECKTSRADFRSDKKKMFRKHLWLSMGAYKWYLTPKGLLKPEEVSEQWGLLEVRGRTIRKIKKGETESTGIIKPGSYSTTAEIKLLLSELRLYQLASQGTRLCKTKRTENLLGIFCSPDRFDKCQSPL